MSGLLGIPFSAAPIRQACQTAEIHERIEQLPEGYPTEIGELCRNYAIPLKMFDIRCQDVLVGALGHVCAGIDARGQDYLSFYGKPSRAGAVYAV